VPKGFHRLGAWPADVFQALVPPEPKAPSPFVERTLVRRDLCELTPFVWKGRLCYLESIRPAAWGKPEDHYLLLRDAGSGKELARTGQGYGLASLLFYQDTFYLFASRSDRGKWRDVTMFRSRDLEHWDSKVVLTGENEEIFNTSVCADQNGFAIAYESNDPAYPPFTIKFARSADLEHWEKVPGGMFGTNRYTACPCLRFVDGWYYALYLEHRTPRWAFETYITRSKDLRHWELSAANPVLRAEGPDEGINASDPDLVEFEGRTLLYFCVSDQLSWMNIKRVTYPGTMAQFLESWFALPGIPDRGTPGARPVTQ
jgi:alpha-L-fucosidase